MGLFRLDVPMLTRDINSGPFGDRTVLEEADIEGDDTEADTPAILRNNVELIENI